MVVNSEDVMNIMGGMENSSGIKLNDHKRKLKNRFEICKKLGQGTYGKVQLGINKETQERVAIKTIKKSKIETEADLIRIRREIQIMSSVQHPNIIHIYEVFENKEKMVLVMEMANGGELYDFLSDKKCLEEHEARRIFRQISTAVFYCHKHKICHRDLKLENILLDENGSAKIADFGLSNVFGGDSLLNTFCGSPLYASPEIVKGSPYEGPEVDCWSLGVLLYTLVYGAMPFDGSNFKRLVRQITTGDYYEPKDASRASSLIRSMLTVQPDMRAKIEDICSHWWVNETYPQSCLTEAEYLASLTPVRLDLLLEVSGPCPKIKETPKIGQCEKPLSIEEIDNEDKAEVKHIEDDILKEPERGGVPMEEENGFVDNRPLSPLRISSPSKETLVSNEASDSGVMMVEDSPPELDNSKIRSNSFSHESNEIEQSIPTTTNDSLLHDDEKISIQTSPPPVFEPVTLPPEDEVKSHYDSLMESPLINGSLHQERPLEMESEAMQVVNEDERNKSPTPPPPPPPLPPPPTVPSSTTITPKVPNLKPKLKIKIDPISKPDAPQVSLSESEVKQPPPPPPTTTTTPRDSPKTTPPEKRENRDSKVIKAAQYWNNYIGDVISKNNKSPDAAQPKPKKIVAAGVGPKGMNELKTAFENGKEAPEKKLARKSSIGGCNPGLKVTDAKNVFEIKAQQPPTPVIYRRNSGAKDSSKTKWTKPKPRPTTPASLENEISLQQIKILQATPPEIITPPPSQAPTPVLTPQSSTDLPATKVSKEHKTKISNVSSMKQLPPPTVEEISSKQPPLNTENEISSIVTMPDTKSIKTTPVPLEPQEDISNHERLELKKPIESTVQDTVLKPSILKKDTKPAETKPLHVSTNIPLPKRELLPTTAPVVIENTKPILRQAKSLDTPSSNEVEYSSMPLNVEKVEIKSPEKMGKQEKPNNSKEPMTKAMDGPKALVGNKPRPSKLHKPKAVQHFENKINAIQPLSSKKEDQAKEIGNERLTKEAHPKTSPPSSLPPPPPPEIPIPEHPIMPPSDLFESSLKTSSLVSSPPAAPFSPPPTGLKPPAVLQTPSQIQQTSSHLKNPAAQEKYVPITMEKEASVEGKTVYHIPVQVESPSPIIGNEDLRYYPTNSLNRRRWGSRKKRMSYSDNASMSDDDGSFFQYPSGLQKQISLGKHGLETAPMFRLRKTRPPFTLQREPSFSSDGEDELEDDGFREMTAENLFSTLLTRVKSLTRRIHDEHEEHINKWHQNQRIVNHPLNPGDTHARLERSALRNSIKRLPNNRRPTYDETPLPSTIPSENLDLACGVSVTSKQRSRPGYLPHPNVHAERIIPINLVNTHDKYDFLSSSSPPIRRLNEPSLDLFPSSGDEDRQRRVSRFLRPDFYDTPREDSIYAKMKDLEDEDRKKSRFLKKIQARNASESCDVLSPLGAEAVHHLPSAGPSNGEDSEPVQLRKARCELDNICEEEGAAHSRSGRRTHLPVLKRGLSESLGREHPHPVSSSPSSHQTDPLSKLLTRRSFSSELFGDDFFTSLPRSRRSISRDLAESSSIEPDLFRHRNPAWPSDLDTSTLSRPRKPRTSINTVNRSDWRRTSVPERGKDYNTLPRNYANFD